MPIALALIVILSVASAFGLPQLGATARRRRWMRKQPIKSIADVRTNDVVCVRGAVVASGIPLALPFRNQPGVLHITHIIDSSNPGETTTFVRTGRCEILLDDGTGHARIASDTRIELLGEEFAGGVGRDEPELMAVLGADRARIFSKGASLVWRQRSIAVGDHVSVWARVIREPDATANVDLAHYRSEPTRALLAPVSLGGAIVVELNKG
jgi:hypothetical protein